VEKDFRGLDPEFFQNLSLPYEKEALGDAEKAHLNASEESVDWKRRDKLKTLWKRDFWELPEKEDENLIARRLGDILTLHIFILKKRMPWDGRKSPPKAPNRE